MLKFQIVTTNASAEQIVEVASADDFIAAMEVRGYEFTGLEQNKRLRAELQGLPMFKGLCGPMYGGEGYAGRYEDWGSYDVLSR